MCFVTQTGTVKQLYEAVGRVKEEAIDSFCLTRGGKTPKS